MHVQSLFHRILNFNFSLQSEKYKSGLFEVIECNAVKRQHFLLLFNLVDYLLLYFNNKCLINKVNPIQTSTCQRST